jgi:hypothetical protein
MRTGAVSDINRAELYHLIEGDPAVYKQGHFLPQFEMWLRRGSYTYVLAHHGNGLDCHRSWEALVLGHVLVLQRSSLDKLYEGLPVILVDDWREVGDIESLLALEINDYQMDKLTNRYWVDKMRRHAEKVMCATRN